MSYIDARPPCKYPRCKLRAENRGYCMDHQTEVKTDNKIMNAKRNPEKVKVYNSGRWKTTRAQILKETPLCFRCSALGKITPAVLVDHLYGFKNESDPHAWGRDFLYPLCFKCHGIVTGYEKRINFLKMPLNEAVRVKYDGAILKDQIQILL